MESDSKRIVYVMKESGWVKVDSLLDVKKGDVFKLQESDSGELVKYKDSSYLLAESDGFLNNSGIGTIKADAYFK